jgi:hypothetical protein
MFPEIGTTIHNSALQRHTLRTMNRPGEYQPNRHLPSLKAHPVACFFHWHTTESLFFPVLK